MSLLLALLLAAATPPSTAPPTEAQAARDPSATPTADVSVWPQGGGLYGAAFEVMGTRAELQLFAPDPASARAAADRARAELRRIEAVMSEWRPETPISQVNAAAGKKPVEVPQELFDVVARALQIAELSGGAFDPTWAGMRGVWRFGDAQDGTVPTDAQIEEKKALVDWRKVKLDPKRRTILLERPGMALGLGGIAKGYAVDRVAGLLRGMGLSDFTVRVGGDLYAAGKKGDRPWNAGIRDPRDAEKVFATLPITDQAFSTSGDYERFFEKDGVRYHHIIDPATGRPATASRSVTALCKDAYTADAVTKPVFILGPGKGIPFAARLGCEVVVVDAANRVHVSGGLQGLLRWTQPTP